MLRDLLLDVRLQHLHGMWQGVTAPLNHLSRQDQEPRTQSLQRTAVPGVSGRTMKDALSRRASGAASWPVSHLNRSGFSMSSTSSKAVSSGMLMRGRLRSAHNPTNRSSSRKPRCLDLYISRLTAVLRCVSPSAALADASKAPADAASVDAASAAAVVTVCSARPWLSACELHLRSLHVAVHAMLDSAS